MSYQIPVSEQSAIKAACLLIYQLFLVLASASQPHEIKEILQLEGFEHPIYRLVTGGYEDGKAFPLPPADPKIHRAIIVNNRCNICWLVMKSLLVSLLNSVNTMIKIDIMIVRPKAHFLLRINNIKPAIWHTILRITTSEGQFVLDLTGEQYGWTGGVFFPLDVYTQRFCEHFDQKCLFRFEDLSPVTDASMEKDFLDDPNHDFWHKAKTHLVDLEREFRSRLPGGAIRREHLVSKRERRVLVGRLRELVYRG